MTWLRRFRPHGVFWRQFLRWAVVNVPYWCEAVLLGFWAMLFMLWRSGRRGVMAQPERDPPRLVADRELLPHLPRDLELRLDASTTTCASRSCGVVPDWEFIGREHFDRMLQRAGRRDHPHRAHGQLRPRRATVRADVDAADRDGARAGDRSADAPVRGSAARARRSR